jgi:putative membrane protein
MPTSKTLLFLAIAGVSSAAIAAEAEDTPPTPTVFVQKAAQDGMTEVELGKVALAKSQNAEVREFAQRMVADHGKANTELAALARQKGIEAPKQLDDEHQAMVRRFEGKSGAAFDNEYSRHMNMDHTKAISLFEAASKSADADFAGFAKKTLPTLKEHKKMASQLPGQ